MRIKGPVLLYGAGREAKSTRRFLAEIAPEAEVHVVVDQGDAKIADTKTVPVSSLTKSFAARFYSLIVRSPGVSIYKPEIIAAKNAGITVTTNVNLWARYKNGESKIVAITGTKGKSTTAKLVYSMLKAGGMDVGLAGNIGVPVLDLEPHEFVVLELSSFQTADLEADLDFIGVTNLFPEHLDWHGSEQRYFSDKLNILRRKKPYKCALGVQVTSQPSLPQPPNDLVMALPKPDLDFSRLLSETLKGSRLKGDHNYQNAVLAARLSMGVGAREDDILEAITEFEPLPHRLQEFQFGGKTFVNDSIATNPEATKAAISAYPDGRVALVIGGYDRNQNYDGLEAFLTTSNLAHVWFLPDTGHRIAREIGDTVVGFTSHHAASFDELFAQLSKAREQFDTVILSPGAPSFNMFENFEKRGELFVEFAQKFFEPHPI